MGAPIVYSLHNPSDSEPEDKLSLRDVHPLELSFSIHGELYKVHSRSDLAPSFIPPVPIRFESTRVRIFEIQNRDSIPMGVIQSSGGSDELLQDVEYPNGHNNRLSIDKELLVEYERDLRLRIKRIRIVLFQDEPGFLLSSRPHLLGGSRNCEAENGEEEEEDAFKASHSNLRTVLLCCSSGTIALQKFTGVQKPTVS